MNKLNKIILNNKILMMLVSRIYHLPRQYRIYKNTITTLEKVHNDKPNVFYFGAARHSNLGDLAQSVCIREWLSKNFPDYNVIEVETNAIVNTSFSVLNQLKKIVSETDLIVFQSGYTTTDLGGFADEMHQVIMKAFPNNKMLMLPQTIFFKSEKNREKCSRVYNSIKNMLYLARDRVSYNMALNMFPDIKVMLFPDIVTTMIGKYCYNNKRDGILFCLRNDGEKYYSDSEIQELFNACTKFCNCTITDTTKPNTKEILMNPKEYIEKEIEDYSRYKIIITDRYHGTILSLVAGTPVIILKTNDHKVITGADWFKGVYDEHVFLANDLKNAYEIVEKLYKKREYNKLKPYFEKEYYDKLSKIFMEG